MNAGVWCLATVTVILIYRVHISFVQVEIGRTWSQIFQHGPRLGHGFCALSPVRRRLLSDSD
jgi:hypothetical protein